MLSQLTPSLRKQMETRVAADIFLSWIIFWIPGAIIGGKIIESGNCKLGFLAKTYVVNAASLSVLCVAPALVISLPPGTSWVYDVFTLGLAGLGAVCGLLAAETIANRSGWVARGLVMGHLGFCALLFCVPIALTVRESYEVFHSSVSVPSFRAPACPPTATYEFVQLSDLHLVAKGDRTRDNSRSGNQRLPRIIDEVQRLHPKFVFITGDMTDGGDEEEWSAVLEQLLKLTNISTVIMSPGNHDLNLTFDLEGVDRSYVAPEAKRVRRFFASQARLNHQLKTYDGTPLPDIVAQEPSEPSEAEYEVDKRRASDCFWSCAGLASSDSATDKSIIAGCRVDCARKSLEYPAFKRIDLIDKYWQEVSRNSFPLREDDNGVAIIVLGTVFKAPAIVGQNALGAISPIQLAHFKEILQTLTPRKDEVFILAHHPFTRPADEDLVIPHSLKFDTWQNSRIFAYSLLRYDSEQARQVVQLINGTVGALPARVFVLFGHRHMKSSSRQGNVSFLESPNIATERDDWNGFFAKENSSADPCWYVQK